MVNEDIITGLRNSVNKGESLEYAMRVMISSGYNAQEVQEASQYISRGVVSMTQPKSTEQLAMPQDRQRIMPKNPAMNQMQQTQRMPIYPLPNQVQPLRMNPQFIPKTNPPQLNQIPLEQFAAPQANDYPAQIQNFSEAKEVQKKSYALEILLFIILLILIGVLVATIVFKEQILQFLSG